MQQQKMLCELPLELWHLISQHLDPKSLACVQAACVYLRTHTPCTCISIPYGKADAYHHFLNRHAPVITDLKIRGFIRDFTRTSWSFPCVARFSALKHLNISNIHISVGLTRDLPQSLESLECTFRRKPFGVFRLARFERLPRLSRICIKFARDFDLVALDSSKRYDSISLLRAPVFMMTVPPNTPHLHIHGVDFLTRVQFANCDKLRISISNYVDIETHFPDTVRVLSLKPVRRMPRTLPRGIEHLSFWCDALVFDTTVLAQCTELDILEVHASDAIAFCGPRLPRHVDVSVYLGHHQIA